MVEASRPSERPIRTAPWSKCERMLSVPWPQFSGKIASPKAERKEAGKRLNWHGAVVGWGK